ncbi:MAG: hypothetical protein GOV15_03675 [Candidatus Diapherotrites archaeon]|nr:hypothetical protein [Candidatus Diapherotrites archaeon]
MDFIDFRDKILDHWVEKFDVQGLSREFLSAVVREHYFQMSNAGLMESKNPTAEAKKAAKVLAAHVDDFLSGRYKLYLRGVDLTADEFNKRVKAWPNIPEGRKDFFPIGNGLSHDDAMGLYKEFSKGKNPFRVEFKLKPGQRKLTGFKHE